MSLFRRTPKPSPEVVQALLNQAALEAKHTVDARMQEDPSFVEAAFEAFVTKKFPDFIGEVDMGDLEAMSLSFVELAVLANLVSKSYFESYFSELLKAPGAETRLVELYTAKKTADAQFSATMDEKQRWAVAVETWRSVSRVIPS
jgi:hypothetical protein